MKGKKERGGNKEEKRKTCETYNQKGNKRRREKGITQELKE